MFRNSGSHDSLVLNNSHSEARGFFFFKHSHGSGSSAAARGDRAVLEMALMSHKIMEQDDTKIFLSFGKLYNNLEVYELYAARGLTIRGSLLSEYTRGEWFSNGFKRKLFQWKKGLWTPDIF